ncbi:hypothetical protein B0H10DRAFT_2208572 [Mycena sp. CBHHK59/15]|nr:hypothetical protein B0H10DRAFT_2208572 [Mycena sp. CBHHK59/15]
MIRSIIKQPWQQQPSYHFLLCTTTISYLVAHFLPSTLRPPQIQPTLTFNPLAAPACPPPLSRCLSSLPRKHQHPAHSMSLPIRVPRNLVASKAPLQAPTRPPSPPSNYYSCNLPSPPLLPRRCSHFAHCHVIQLPAHSVHACSSSRIVTFPPHTPPACRPAPIPSPTRATLFHRHRAPLLDQPFDASPSYPLSLVTTAVASTFRNCKHHLKILLGLLRSMPSVRDSHIVKTINPIVSIFKASRPHVHRLKLQGIHPVTPGSIWPVKLDAKR